MRIRPIVAAFAAFASLAATAVTATPVTFSGNGHSYEVIWDSDISWTEARLAAEARSHKGQKGYLATVTSAAEWSFLTSSFNPNRDDLWLGGTDAVDPMQGGDVARETDQVWRWATGPEAGTVFWNNGPVANVFSAWDRNEPNNYFVGGNPVGEDFLAGWSWGRDLKWNDLPNSHGKVKGYVVEYGGLPLGPTPAPGPAPVPLPAGLPLMAAGFGVMALVRRFKA